MKNQISITILILISLIFFSCSDNRWSDVDREKFRNELINKSPLSDFKGFFNDKNVEAYIECNLEKAQNNFSSFEELSKDSITLEKFSLSCYPLLRK